VTTVTETVVPESTTHSAVPSATCGEVGPFEINVGSFRLALPSLTNVQFDNLPAYSTDNNDTADFPPIFNPFDHLFWGDGWTYVPPPIEPFPPQSGSQLAEFIPSPASNDTGSPDAGLIPSSSFGAGPRNYDSQYWFNATSVYVGCDNGATDPDIMCDFVATGYQWDPETREERVVVTQHFPQPPCPNFKNCTLRQIFFNDEFTALTTLSFYANVRGMIKIFFMDTIELGWYNNTCAAGLARSSSRKT